MKLHRDLKVLALFIFKSTVKKKGSHHARELRITMSLIEMKSWLSHCDGVETLHENGLTKQSALQRKVMRVITLWISWIWCGILTSTTIANSIDKDEWLLFVFFFFRRTAGGGGGLKSIWGNITSKKRRSFIHSSLHLFFYAFI